MVLLEPYFHSELVVQHLPFPTHLLVVEGGAGQTSGERAKGRIVLQDCPR